MHKTRNPLGNDVHKLLVYWTTLMDNVDNQDTFIECAPIVVSLTRLLVKLNIKEG
jgi:hypothetical protein